MSGRPQTSVEAIYGFVGRTVLKTAGPDAKPPIPFMSSLFVFVPSGSLLGLTPVEFTFISHLIVTLAHSRITSLHIRDALHAH